MSIIEVAGRIDELARAAGNIILEAYKHPTELGTELKHDKTFVTKADRRIQKLAVAMMASLFPDLPVIGEEGSSGHKNARDGLWVNIDEVDGTGALALGVPTSLVMIALMEKTRPIYSVIYNPFGDRMYTARKDYGATCNGTPIRVKPVTNAPPVVSVIGWPKRGQNDMLVEKMFDVVVPKLHAAGCELYNVGSNLPVTLVAEGTFDAAIFPGRAIHDTSAGDLLVREAGGCATDLRGMSLWYGGKETFGHVFSNSIETHKMILPIINQALAM